MQHFFVCGLMISGSHVLKSITVPGCTVKLAGSKSGLVWKRAGSLLELSDFVDIRRQGI